VDKAAIIATTDPLALKALLFLIMSAPQTHMDTREAKR
jgi:hypothetical protein